MRTRVTKPPTELERTYGILPELPLKSVPFEKQRNQGLWILFGALAMGGLVTLLIATGGIILPLTETLISEILVGTILTTAFTAWVGLSIYFRGVDKDPYGHENYGLDMARSPRFRKIMGLSLLAIGLVGFVLMVGLGSTGLLGALSTLQFVGIAITIGSIAVTGIRFYLKGAILKPKGLIEQNKDSKKVLGRVAVGLSLTLLAVITILTVLEFLGFISLGVAVFGNPVILGGLAALTLAAVFSSVIYMNSELIPVEAANYGDVDDEVEREKGEFIPSTPVAGLEVRRSRLVHQLSQQLSLYQGSLDLLKDPTREEKLLEEKELSEEVKLERKKRDYDALVSLIKPYDDIKLYGQGDIKLGMDKVIKEELDAQLAEARIEVSTEKARLEAANRAIEEAETVVATASKAAEDLAPIAITEVDASGTATEAVALTNATSAATAAEATLATAKARVELLTTKVTQAQASADAKAAMCEAFQARIGSAAGEAAGAGAAGAGSATLESEFEKRMRKFMEELEGEYETFKAIEVATAAASSATPSLAAAAAVVGMHAEQQRRIGSSSSAGSHEGLLVGNDTGGAPMPAVAPTS